MHQKDGVSERERQLKRMARKNTEAMKKLGVLMRGGGSSA